MLRAALAAWLAKGSSDSLPAASVASDSKPYQAGQRTRNSRRHNPPAMSGDAMVYSGYDLAGRRGRQMYMDETWFRRPIEVVRDLAVGTGIHTFSDPLDYTFGVFVKKRQSDLMASFDYALESDEKFLRWASDPELCDVKKKQNIFQMQAMCLTETGQVGDAIMKLVYLKNVPKGEVPLKVQMIEREQLDTTKDTGQYVKKGNRIINGIEFDPDGYEVGIHVLDAHPHDAWGVGTSQSTFVPARFYLHFYKKCRPSQHVGAVLMPTIAPPVRMSNEWKNMQLRKAIKQAHFVLLHKTDGDQQMTFGQDPDDPDPLESDEVSYGNDPIAVRVGTNDEVELIDSSSPESNADGFLNRIDTDVAAAANISPYSMSGRYERVNQSGFRAGMQLEAKQMKELQHALGVAIALPLRREFNRLAVASGVITSITPAQFISERSRFQRFDCIGPGRILLDEEMEFEAAMLRIRGGFSTLKIECAKLGLHYIQVLRQIKIENLITDELGVVLDHSKGQGGQVDQNTRSGSGENSDAVATPIQ